MVACKLKIGVVVGFLIFRVTCCQVNARSMNVLYFYILKIVSG